MAISKSIVFLGASGAVGSAALDTLVNHSGIHELLLLGRKELEVNGKVNPTQQLIDIANSESYRKFINGFETAICTLGVGEPSKMSKEDFLKIDQTAVLDFAKSCKENGVKHFQLLSSVSISANSKNFYLRSKGELVEALEALEFERLSVFQPSMIITPTNRYGISQAIVLAIWPKLDFILQGKATQYRGIKVAELGKAIAYNAFTKGSGTEYLLYDQFKSLINLAE